MRMAGLLIVTYWLARPTASSASFTSTLPLALRSMASTTAAVIDKKDQASKRKPSQAIVSRQSTLRKKFYAIPNPDSKGPKKLIVNRPPLFRADRVLSNRGFGSRSECFDLLKGRRVAVWANEKWNNILGPSQRIHTESRIMVDGKEVPRTPLLLLFHKPKWVLSVMRDPKDRPNLSQLLPEKYVRQGLHPVGRLDYDSSGLLLFSSSGPLTQRLLHPSHEISKEYVATVEGLVNPEELHSLLEGGVETAEGVHTANLVNVKHLKPHDAKAILKHMRDNLPKEYNTDDLEERGYLKKDIMEMSEVSLVVSEGKHRMVRRMLANCGHPVVELKREKHGEVRLGDLPEGEFRDLTEEELEWVMTVMPPRSKKGKNRKSE